MPLAALFPKVHNSLLWVAIGNSQPGQMPHPHRTARVEKPQRSVSAGKHTVPVDSLQSPYSHLEAWMLAATLSVMKPSTRAKLTGRRKTLTRRSTDFAGMTITGMFFDLHQP